MDRGILLLLLDESKGRRRSLGVGGHCWKYLGIALSHGRSATTVDAQDDELANCKMVQQSLFPVQETE